MLDTSLKDLSRMVSRDEKILWFAKPNKKCFIFECIFNRMLPFALIWLLFDGFFIFGLLTAKNGSEELGFIIPFFAFHLMPVWIYLAGAITCFIKYKNSAYIITTKGVYISSGVISRSQEMKPFTDLSHINIHRGFFDQIFGVGDVVLTCAHHSHSSRHRSGLNGFAICDIPDYERVYKMVSDLQTDIYSDTMYPNALRPENNPGYNTRYEKYPETRLDDGRF